VSNSNIYSASATTTAQVVDGRTRLVGVYFVTTTTAATLTFKSGGASGTTNLTLTSPLVAGSQYIKITDMGILFEDGVHVTFSTAGVTSITLFYYGGKAS
jgi:hypothetical protein